MSPHKRLFKQKSQSLFDDCHTPFDLLFISAFVRLFTESFAKSKVLLRKPTACSSLGIPVKIFGLTGATAGLLGWVFFGGMTVIQAGKKTIFWGLAHQSLGTVSVL